MTLVDDRGRIAGRVNLIDALAAIAIVLVLPVSYGAYLLFRTPPAKLTGIAPATLYQGPNLRVGISGKNLRPFMRVTFNDVQGRTFMIASTTNAAIDLPDLGPGTYDVVLYDHMEEIDRLKKAMTILPLAPQPTIAMVVGGSFLSLNRMDPVTPGQRFPPDSNPPLAEVLAVGAPVPASLNIRAGEVSLPIPIADQLEVPATVRLLCYAMTSSDGTVRCLYPGPTQPIIVAPDAILTLQGPKGWVTFQIAEVHVTSQPLVARGIVSFAVTDPILARMKAGDADVSARANAEGHRARIVSINRGTSPGQSVTVTLDVPVEQVSEGWTYKREPFKIGVPFSFETSSYVVHGVVLDMTPPALSAGAAKH
jgi:hypothetical protein